MNKKQIVITSIISIFIVIVYLVNNYYTEDLLKANKAYQVYLDGELLGQIENQDSLYELINQEQRGIKEKYGVDRVYPPDGFELVEVNTYNDNYAKPEAIYEKISNLDNFTIKGYIISVNYKDEEREDIKINVLDKDVFIAAAKKLILAFISEEDYDKYINDEFEDLTDIGTVINNMYFDETITIKEGYISVDDEIYADVDSLSQYLLFGKDAKMDSYTIALGDTIDSISDKYKLNPQEFIIANPSYRGEDVILSVGEKVNVTLLNPVITFVYEVSKIERTETPYAEKTIVDKTKNPGEIVTPGVTGITLNHEQFKVTNGEQSSEITIVESVAIREKIDQVKVARPYSSAITGSYVDIEGDWGWPTNRPSVITSKYGMRWGKLHAGIDISGTGNKSPIYAVGEGTVVAAVDACPDKKCMRWQNGTYLVIEHKNGYFSAYLHMDSRLVSVGDHVTKGQQIGRMGQSGYATGVHLHFALFKGQPYAGQSNQSVNPLTTIFKGVK